MSHDDCLTETKRDRRRRDRKRIVALLRRRAMWSIIWSAKESSEAELEQYCTDYVRWFYSARRTCRGPCCADPRRWYKRMTYKERRAEVDAREQFEELGLKFKPSRFSWGW